QRARRVADVGDVRAAQFEDEPRIDGAECQFAALGGGARTGNVVQQPAQLGAREIRIEHEAGLLAEQRFLSLRAESVAHGCGATVLPHDGRSDRLAGGAVPYDRGLALVGDADCRDLVCGGTAFVQYRTHYLELGFPDLFRIVFDPARLCEYLTEFLLCDAVDVSGAVEKNGTRACGALVDGENETGIHLSVLRSSHASSIDALSAERCKPSFERRHRMSSARTAHSLRTRYSASAANNYGRISSPISSMRERPCSSA